MRNYSGKDAPEIKAQRDCCERMIECLSGGSGRSKSSPEEIMKTVRHYINYWKYALNTKDTRCISELKQYQEQYRALFPSLPKERFPAKDRRLLFFLYVSPHLVYRIVSVLTRINGVPKRVKLFRMCCARKKQRSGLETKSFAAEYKKYSKCLKNDNFPQLLLAQIDEFFGRNIDCLSRQAAFSAEGTIPTVVCVVKNEAERMRLFYHHYRKLGVTQFAILDNGSTDGTREYLLQQPDTHVYSVNAPFETQKKTAWIEKLLAMEGYNRWYIVADSDELLDYPGSEETGITQMIARLAGGGYNRAWGLLLDMYSDRELFSVDCDALQIPETLCWFDSDTYIHRYFLTDSFRKMTASIIGGPRYRLFGTTMLQSKQPVFYYTSETLYRNCHFLWPQICWEEAPCCFVLKHYKFLKSDAAEYRKRVSEKNFFNGSAEYVQQMAAIDKGAHSMLYEKSVRYDSSYSLRRLPMLQDVLHGDSQT